MNKVIIVGRLTRDAETRYSQGENSTAVSRFTVAVDRRKKDSGTDFIGCVSFGKTAEFMEKYGKKGTKFICEGRIQTGSYEKDGQKVYTTDVVVESVEFAESKSNASQPSPSPSSDDGFMNIPEGIDEMLPFV